MIFTDISSTTEYMAPYLVDKKDITVITINIAIVTHLSEFPNIRIICMGGEMLDAPSMLGGDLCVKNVMEYKADKFFFISIGINDNGEIVGGERYKLLLNVMRRNSNKTIYLVDHEKVNLSAKNVIMTANDVDIIVTDYKFSDTFKSKYGDVEFIEV